jgi:hypothetical protein
MKKIVTSMYPWNILSRFILIVKELYFFFSYLKTIKQINPELEEMGIVKASRYSLVKAVNLKVETLLLANSIESDMNKDETEELQKLELSFVSREISKYNDIFITHGIIELIKTKAERVKNKDYYGYMVEIHYNWNNATLYQFLRIIFQISIWTLLLYLIPYTTIIKYCISAF